MNDAFGVDLDNTDYVLDTTTIDLSLKVFPWAHFRKTKAAVKMPTQIDLQRRLKRSLRIHFESMDQRPPSPAANNLRRATSGTAR